MSIHTPERAPSESQAAYRLRRQLSATVARAACRPGLTLTTAPSGTIHRKPRGDSGQHPKLAKARKHKQHVHPLRDGNGAYTLVGSTITDRVSVVDGIERWRVERMQWLAGISAQRGY